MSKRTKKYKCAATDGLMNLFEYLSNDYWYDGRVILKFEVLRLKRKIFQTRLEPIDILIISSLFGMSVIFVGVSLVNHWRFMTFGWDLGFYNQIAWQCSKFQFPYSTFSQEWAFAVRFSPILCGLVPFYWIWPKAEVLLVVQAVLAVLGVWPLYLLAKLLTKNQLVWLSVASVYLSFIGLHRAVFFDFHPDTIMPFLVGWVMYFAHRGNLKWTLVCGVLLLLTKEWVGLLVASMGLMLWFYGIKKIGWYLLGIGLVGFFVTIYGVIIPLGGRDTPVFDYGEAGDTPVEVFVTFATRPWVVGKLLVSPSVKVETVIKTLAPTLFLPLLSPIALIPMGLQWLIRFLDATHQQAWDLRLHYSAPMTPFLAYGCLMALRKTKFQNQLAVGLLASGVVSMCVFHSPVFTILKPEFYRGEDWVGDTREVMDLIPDKVSVAAQNNLAPHLSSRNQISVLPMLNDADFIVVDLRPNQSEYNFSPGESMLIKLITDELIKTEQYRGVASKGGTKLLKRVSL